MTPTQKTLALDILGTLLVGLAILVGLLVL
jgi:hypothetical protein